MFRVSCYEHRLILKISQDASVLYLESLVRTNRRLTFFLMLGMEWLLQEKVCMRYEPLPTGVDIDSSRSLNLFHDVINFLITSD